jgi:predicted dehydrogenase
MSLGCLLEASTAVVVATPPGSHVPIALAALSAGCHVFVEKPMALSRSDAEELVSAAVRADRVLMVGHILRYHAGVERARAACAAGALGDILEVHCERLSPNPVQRAEGAWWTLAPHDVDLVRWLFATNPIAIEASGTVLTQARIGFERGVGRIWVGQHEHERQRRLAVFGTRASLVLFDEGESYRLEWFGPASEHTLCAGTDQALATACWRSRETATLEQDPLTREVAHFVEAVLDGVSVRSNATDGLECVKVLAAGSESIARQGACVRLD